MKNLKKVRVLGLLMIIVSVLVSIYANNIFNDGLKLMIVWFLSAVFGSFGVVFVHQDK